MEWIYISTKRFSSMHLKTLGLRWRLDLLHTPLLTAILLLSLIVLPGDEELGLVGRHLTGSLEEAAF